MGEGSMKLTFMGGPKDGERLPVERSARTIFFPVPMSPDIGQMRREFENEPELIQSWVYVYEKRALKNGEGQVRLVMQYRGEAQR